MSDSDKLTSLLITAIKNPAAKQLQLFRKKKFFLRFFLFQLSVEEISLDDIHKIAPT